MNTKQLTVPSHGQERKSSLKKYFSVYSLMFLSVSAVVFFAFFKRGQTFISVSDGWTQHYKALIYYSEYLRTVLKNLFTLSRPIFPQYDFTIGLGGDILTSFHYYAIGDPLNLLSVFVPAKFIWVFFNALVVLRLYLAGVFFSLYCFQMKHKNAFAVLSGAFVYAFCGFALILSGRHPFFTNPMIYFPLLLIGVEKVLEKRPPVLLAAAVCISAASNFYFFYILVVMVVIYVLVRLIGLYHGDNIKQAAKPFFSIAAGSVCGVLMSAAVFLPVVTSFLSDSRTTGGSFSAGLLYDVKYYLGLVSSFIAPVLTEKTSHLVYSVTALLAVIILFTRRGNAQKKTFFALGILMFSFPIFGSVLNGFSYESNRWGFAFSFLVAFILTDSWKYFTRLNKKQFAALSVLFALFCAVCLNIDRARTVYFGISAAIGAAALVLLGLYNLPNKKKLGKKTVSICMLVLTLFGICSNAVGTYSDRYFEKQVTTAQSKNIYTQADKEIKALTEKNKDEFSRYAGNITYAANINGFNSATIAGNHGTAFYWSLSNPAVTSFREQLGMRENILYKYKGFDDRTILNTLSSVKYFYGYSGNPDYAGCGWKSTKYPNVYQNKYFLPLGYTYDSFITAEEFEKLAPLQKQEAMLQGAVLQTAPDGLKKAEISLTQKELPYTIKFNKNNVSVEGNCFCVLNNKAEITFEFKGIPNGESYLSFCNLHYISPIEKPLKNASDNVNSKEYPDASIIMRASFGKNFGAYKTLQITTPEYNWYTGRHDFDVNLGYDKNSLTSVTMIFEHPGTYSFDSIKAFFQPMDKYPAQVERLSEDVLRNINIGTNEVTGKISLDSPKLLTLTVPYSKGWTAYVDGEKAEILNVNVMFSGLLLQKGEHEIRLVYHTPMLKAGVIISALSLCALAAYTVLLKKKKKET